MVNLKTKGIILFIVGAILFPCPADARRVKEKIKRVIRGRASFTQNEQVYFPANSLYKIDQSTLYWSL